jgi:hypothetical protein
VIRGCLVLGVVASIALAACSGGGAPTAPASGGAGDGGPTAAPQTASTGTAGGPAGTIDVCAVVTVADVASLFSGPVTAKTEPGLVGTASGCQYISNQYPDDESLTIEVVTGDQAASFWNGNVPPQGQDAIPLTGVGDKAMRAAGAPDFVSLKGSIFCEAEAGSANTEIYSGLATPDASDNVPDDSATAFAQRMGALCNKVFASQRADTATPTAGAIIPATRRA